MNATTTVIDLQGVGKTFDGPARPIHALKDVHLDVHVVRFQGEDAVQLRRPLTHGLRYGKLVRDPSRELHFAQTAFAHLLEVPSVAGVVLQPRVPAPDGREQASAQLR